MKPGRWMDWNGVLRLLKRETRAAGGPAKWAAANGVSYEYVRLVLNSQRVPGPAIVKSLGLEKALMWRRHAVGSSPERGK